MPKYTNIFLEKSLARANLSEIESEISTVISTGMALISQRDTIDSRLAVTLEAAISDPEFYG